MSKEEVDAATRQYAGTGTVSQPPPVPSKPPPPPSKAFDSAKKGFLNNNAKLYDDDEAKKRTTEYEPEFDAAMAELDPEFSNAHKNEQEDTTEDDTIAQLRDFAAKVDWASCDFSKPLAPARDYTKHDHSQRPKPSVETEARPAPGSRKQDPGELQRGFMARDAERSAAKAAVRAARAETFSTSVDRTEDGRVRVVAALDGCSFNDIDLDVALKTLRVREKGGRRRSSRVELPCDVDAASASAKFSKKRGQLTVVLAPSAD